MEQLKWGRNKVILTQSLKAYPGFEPSTALTHSSCNEGSSSLRGATAFTYSISKIFSCNLKDINFLVILVKKKESNESINFYEAEDIPRKIVKQQFSGTKITAEMPLASRNSSSDIRTSSPLIRKSNGSVFQSAFPGYEQLTRLLKKKKFNTDQLNSICLPAHSTFLSTQLQ